MDTVAESSVPAPVARPAPEIAPPPPAAGPSPPAPLAPAARPCAHCAAPLTEGQDWCLECGAGAPLAAPGHAVWRPAATVLALTALLVVATVAVAYAALSTPPRRTIVTHPPAAVALVPPVAHPAAPTPVPPPVTAPTHTPPPAATPLLPRKAVTPPPAITKPTPAPSVSPSASTPTSTTTTHTSSTTTSTLPAPNPSHPAPAPNGAPVVLDPAGGPLGGAYNPGGYPDSAFGDPSLAIDGDPSSAWSVQVQRRQAPRVDAGLVLDLNKAQKLSTLTLITDTPGQSVGIYGANADQPPPAITDAGWKLLSPVRRTRRTSTFTLATGGTPYRFVLVWITTASGPSVATADLNEISLRH